MGRRPRACTAARAVGRAASPPPLTAACPSLPPSSQFVNSTSFIVGQPCVDTSYGPMATTSSFLPKIGDFSQVGELQSEAPLPHPRAAPTASAGSQARCTCGWLSRLAGAPQPPPSPRAPRLQLCLSGSIGGGPPMGELGWRSHNEGWGAMPTIHRSHPGVGCRAASFPDCHSSLPRSTGVPACATQAPWHLTGVPKLCRVLQVQTLS